MTNNSLSTKSTTTTRISICKYNIGNSVSRAVGVGEIDPQQYLQQGHDSLMLAVGEMLAEAAGQRLIHVKFGAQKVSGHASNGDIADGGTAAPATRQLLLQLLLLLLLAVAGIGRRELRLEGLGGGGRG